MKSWFGRRGFDYSQVARLEFAIARKAQEQAASGALKILHIDVLGREERPPPFDVEQREFTTLAELPLDDQAWETAKSKQARIELTSEAGALSCAVELPFNPARGEELPWTNLQTALEQRQFRGLEAIELELQFTGEPEGAPVTIEPKLIMAGHVYGAQRRLHASADPQRIVVGLHELRYYFAHVGAEGEPRIDIDKLTAFGLGVSRKAQDQASQGALRITAVRLLGPNQPR